VSVFPHRGRRPKDRVPHPRFDMFRIGSVGKRSCGAVALQLVAPRKAVALRTQPFSDCDTPQRAQRHASAIADQHDGLLTSSNAPGWQSAAG